MEEEKSNSFIERSSDSDESSADEDELLQRKLQFEKNLEGDFDDVSLSDVNASGSSDSDSSDDETALSNHSQSAVPVKESSIQDSYVHSVQPNEPNQHSELIRPEIPAIEPHSDISVSDVHYVRTSNVNYSNNSGVNNSRDSTLNDSNNSDGNDSVNLHQSNSRNSVKMNDTNNSNVEQLDTSDVPHKEVFPILEQQSDVFRITPELHSFRKTSFEPLDLNADQYDYGDVASRKSLEQQYQELCNEYKKLQLIHNNQSQMLSQFETNAIRIRGNLENNVKSLSSRLKIIEADNNRLTSSLQQAQNIISDITHENNELKGRLNALEINYSAEKTTKEATQAKLESAEITIQTLEQQIKVSNQSENAIRLQQQNESVVKDLKLRHQKEVLKYKEEIDKLHGNLNAKINESETLSSDLSKLQKKYQELHMEKCDIFNTLSAKLQNTQKEYQKLLESGNITEVAHLRLQLNHLQEENSKQEKKIFSLKDEVKSLEGELRAIETTNILTLEKESLLDKRDIGESNHSDSVKAKLQQTLKMNQSLRMDNQSYKEKIEKLERKLSLEEERAKLFESHYRESESKLQELERKLEEVLPYGSIPVSQHEMKVKSLESEINEYQKKLYDFSEKMKTSSSIEGNLREENEALKSKIEKHAEEKLKIINHCKEKCYEEIKKAVEKTKHDLTHTADNELKTVKWNYDNKITELQKQIKELSDKLYEAREQYVKICEEHKVLQSMPQAKEIKEMRVAYEKKLEKVKKKHLEDIAQIKSTLQQEAEKSKTEWAQQKFAEMKAFIDKTKRQLAEEFVKCLDMEKSKLADEYAENLKNLQSKFETEKSNLHANFQLKWKNEMNKNEQNIEAEMKSITEKYNKRIAALENEIVILKEKNNYDLEQKAEIEKLKAELMQHYEKEKHDYSTKLRENFQNKWKNEKKELQQSHQNDVESLKERFQLKIMTLEEEKKNLKENHLKEIESKEMQIHKEKSDLLKNEFNLRNELLNAEKTQKKLEEKIELYKRTIHDFKKYHKKKSSSLQEQIEELTNSVVNKEKEFQSMKHEYDSYRQSLEETRQKYSSIRNAQCQTEDKVVPIGAVYNIFKMMKQRLINIAEQFIACMCEYQKCIAEQFPKCLNNYDLYAKISKKHEDELKDALSNSPDVGISQINSNLKSTSACKNCANSPKNVQHQLNSNYRISNSTPFDAIISGNNQKNLRSQMNHLSNVKVLQNAQSAPDIDNGFADMSFDFMPIKLRDLDQTSVKLPQGKQYM